MFVIDESGFIQVTAGEEGGRISTNVDGKADFVNCSFGKCQDIIDGLKEMSEQPLTISIYEKEMIVKYANGKFTMPIEDGKQYPEMNIDDSSHSFLLSGNDLLYGVRQVQFCSANDELRPTMNGVYFDIDLEKDFLCRYRWQSVGNG